MRIQWLGVQREYGPQCGQELAATGSGGASSRPGTNDADAESQTTDHWQRPGPSGDWGEARLALWWHSTRQASPDQFL